MSDAIEAATARKTCPRCRTEQNIDQFYDARGNVRIVINCLSCRNKTKLYVMFIGYNLSFLRLTYRRLTRHERAFRLLARSPVETIPPVLSHPRLPLHPGLDGTLHTAFLLRCFTKGATLLQIPRKWQPLGMNNRQSSDAIAWNDATASSIRKPRR